MSTSPAAAHSSSSFTLKNQPNGPAVIATPGQFWRRNSPTSLMRAPLWFTSDEDRQYYRKGIRILALVYAGILVLVVAVTALRGEWATATASAVTAADHAHPLSADLGRERARTRP
jgi:hypothetical protein